MVNNYTLHIHNEKPLKSNLAVCPKAQAQERLKTEPN